MPSDKSIDISGLSEEQRSQVIKVQEAAVKRHEAYAAFQLANADLAREKVDLLKAGANIFMINCW
jgi:hypothetical protein